MKEPEDKIVLDKIRSNIVRIRTEKGLTVRELAARADMEPSVIQNFVKGRSDIVTTNLIKIARGLAVSLERLVQMDA
jgi:transcriptional regulator with XRE-family HTH domain